MIREKIILANIWYLIVGIFFQLILKNHFVVDLSSIGVICFKQLLHYTFSSRTILYIILPFHSSLRPSSSELH